MNATAESAAPAIDLPLVRRGKVRDVYELPGSRLLLVASDRVSAYDVVMPTPIPGKGKLLTAMATFWFHFIAKHGICETHFISDRVSDVPAGALGAPGSREWLEGRMTIGRQCKVVPIECVVRGYLEGSGWKEYQQSGKVCGIELPRGLKQCDRLPEPIFTPATKEESGHDQNISFDEAAERVGLETMSVLRELSLKIYTTAAAHALARGIIIADTKFEFGLPAGTATSAGRVWQQPILIDEALTPDSSRFWPADSYQPGGPQKSFDKQYLREYLETLVKAGKWDKTPPGPELPREVVEGTLRKYEEAKNKLTR